MVIRRCLENFHGALYLIFLIFSILIHPKMKCNAYLATGRHLVQTCCLYLVAVLDGDCIPFTSFTALQFVWNCTETTSFKQSLWGYFDCYILGARRSVFACPSFMQVLDFKTKTAPSKHTCLHLCCRFH